METQILSLSSLSTSAPEQINGVRSIGMRSQLALLLERSLGTGNLLADPLEKPGTLEWHTQLSGPITPYTYLRPESKNSVRAALAAISKNMEALGLGLSYGEGKQQEILGQILERLSKTIAAFLSGSPTTLEVFLVGGNLVLSGWGLEGRGLGLPTEAQKEYAKSVLMTGILPPDTSLSGALAQGTVPASKSGEGGETLWYILKTAVAALLTFIVLSLLALLLIPGLRNLVITGKDRTLGQAYDRGEIASLNERIYTLREKYLDSLDGCSPMEVQLELAALPKEANESQEDVEVAQALYSVKAPEPEPAPPKPQAKPQSKPKATPKSPAKAEPARGKGFTIPEGGDPNDLSFLEGCWELTSSLYSTATRMPLTYRYCFNDKGTGTASVKELDDSGRLLDTCTGTINASRRGNSVSISDSGVRCSGGSRYVKCNMSCSNGANNSTNCRGNSGGNRFTAQFKYLGSS
ncbi:MAG: hypothetical protein LBE27_05170 [Deltaproteobacteria bacterium]|nr:hypothetical protein [Deltaproteobacteria bacterium]